MGNDLYSGRGAYRNLHLLARPCVGAIIFARHKNDGKYLILKFKDFCEHVLNGHQQTSGVSQAKKEVETSDRSLDIQESFSHHPTMRLQSAS